MDNMEIQLARLIDPDVPEAVIASGLLRLADLPITASMLATAVRMVMERAVTRSAPAGTIDVCGTGGDHRHSLNVSTAVAFVSAACGARVAKHGNRAASSRSGATDVLEALGINTGLTPDASLEQLQRCGLTFLNAARYHPALARLAPHRKALGRPTLFNLIGPLLNPFGIRRQLIGVYAPELAGVMAEAARKLGRDCAWVVCGGLDELSLTENNHVAAATATGVAAFKIDSRSLGFPRPAADSLTGGDANHNAAALVAMLEGASGAYRDTVLLNTAAALVVAGLAEDLPSGIAMARFGIDRGAALALLHSLQETTL